MYDAALVLSLLCLLGVAFSFLRSRAFSVFHPLSIYIAFHGLLFVFRPIVARILEFHAIYRFYEFTPSDADKLTVILAANLGFLSFTFFALRVGNLPMLFKQDSFIAAERSRLMAALPWMLAFCVPVGLYSLISLWNDSAEGVALADMVRDKATGFTINTTSNGYLRDAQLMLMSCAAIVAWLFRFRMTALMPIIAIVIIRAGTGGRGSFVTGLATLALFYFYETRQRFPGFKIIILTAAMALVFAQVGADRGRAIRQAFGVDRTAEGSYAQESGKFMEGMDFGNLEYFEYIVYVVPQRSHTYDYFLDNLQLFTDPIPRALWKSKPIGAPFNRIYLMDYGFPIGITRSLPGEGWFAMGWIGVFIWCGLWGHGLGYVYRKYVESPQNTIITAAYIVFVPIMIVAFRDGQLVSVAVQSAFFLLPVVIWKTFARLMALPTAQQLRAEARVKLRMMRRANPGIENLTLEDFAPIVLPKPTTGAALHLPPAVARRRRALRSRA